MPPNIANARMHWIAKHRARKAYFHNCDCYQEIGFIRPPPPDPISRVSLGSTLYLGNYMDDDNALARIKWAADWLKRRGYIVDDKRPHCQFTIPAQVVKRGQQYKLVITLTPLAA